MRKKEDIEKLLDRFLHFIGEGEKWEAYIEKKSKIPKDKRSLNANAYLWLLCRKISQKLPEPRPTEEYVYQDAIRHAGLYTDRHLLASEMDDMRKEWDALGIGYMSQMIDYIRTRVQIGANIDYFYKVRMFIGSSAYTEEPMRYLLSYIVQQAKDLDIETLTPKQLEEMVERWAEECQMRAG